MRFVIAFLVNLLFWSSVSLAQSGRQLVQDGPVAQKRIALVIGNGRYQRVSPLDNPVNDATDIAAVLETLGFDVIKGTDTNLARMRQLIREFGKKLAQHKGIGLFYYAGHGVEVRGRNFLVPVDADISREVETEDYAIDVNTVLRQMEDANNGFNIVTLDACRNNPFSRGWSRSGDLGGLANVNAPTGTYIAFAAAPGKTASDGKGTRNGIFTGALLKILKRPNLKLEEVFKATREEVMALTERKQVPWDSSSVQGDFYFLNEDVRVKDNNAAREPPSVNTESASVKSNGQQKASLIRGTWKGTMYQDGVDAFLVIVTFNECKKDEKCGSYEHPSLNCSGTLTGVDFQNNIYVLYGRIEYGRQRCLDGLNHFILENGDTLTRIWIRPDSNNEGARGTLKRVR